MAWTRGVLRCAVLRRSPGDDVLAEGAHRRCRFGHWLQRHRERFDELDAVTLGHLHDRHRQMHDAARCIGRRILEGEVGDARALDRFERTQIDIVADRALVKNAYLAHSARLAALTGLPLRYGLEEEFLPCRAQAQRHEERLVALMLDLDHFKRINDAAWTCGRRPGSAACRGLAAQPLAGR
jgi:diguanylate cyclase